MEAKLRVGRVWRAPAEEILPVSTSAAFFEAGADTIEPAFEGICGWTPFQPVCIDRRHPNEIGAVGQRCEVCLRRLRHQLVDDIDKAGINAELDAVFYSTGKGQQGKVQFIAILHLVGLTQDRRSKGRV